MAFATPASRERAGQAVAAPERQHDDTEREHRQSHEFEYQRVKHGNSPNKPIDLQEAIERLLISGAAVRSANASTVNVYVPQNVCSTRWCGSGGSA